MSTSKLFEVRQPRATADDALRFVRVVTWLDDARWSHAQDPISNPLYNALHPAQKLLVHWLCYITNRQRAFRQTWEDGGFVFAAIVADYSASARPAGAVERLLERYQIEGKRQLPAYYVKNGTREVAYTPRYGADHDSIERTLAILCEYGRSLPSFISDFIMCFREEDEGLRRLAHCLDLLSYRLDVRIEDAVPLLQSGSDLSRHFRGWNRSATQGHKRLWASLRDYRKPGSPFRQYLEAQVSWPEQGFELDQMELPGDVWNLRFSQRFVGPIASAVGLTGSTRRASKMARRLFDRVVRLDPQSPFYPERLDFSFDFTPRMCESEMCDVCLFAKPVGLPCVARVPQDGRMLCPVLLFSCGYRQPCVVNGCPVAEGISYGLCSPQ